MLTAIKEYIEQTELEKARRSNGSITLADVEMPALYHDVISAIAQPGEGKQRKKG